MVFKNNLIMILSDEGEFDGVYIGDLRILKGFDVNVDFQTFEAVEKPKKKVRYLMNREKVVGVLSSELSIEDETVSLNWRLKAFEDLLVTVAPSLEISPADLMSLRGYCNVKVEWKKIGRAVEITSPGMMVRVELVQKGFGSKKLGKGEIAEGSISARIGYELKGRISDVLEISSNEGLSDLVSISPELRELSISTKFGRIPLAGLPWYGAFFGRDLLVFGLQTLKEYPEVPRRILTFLAEIQGKGIDQEAEEEPGRIIHEARIGPSDLVYYGAIDTAPLFILLTARYFERTADMDFARHIKPALLKAIEWCESYGDLDGDGLLEYGTSGFLRNKGWKDSDEAVVHKNGDFAEGPVALIEVQGYLHAAYSEVVNLLDAFGEKELADLLSKRAAVLKAKVEELFATDEYFAIALDGNKKRVETVTSNPAHALYSGIFSKDTAWKIAQRLMKRDLLTMFGVRTMSSEETPFNPVSYHNGSIWPHDNWFIAEGLLRYGFRDEAKEVVRAVMRASKYFGGKLPELFVYVDGFEEPLLYPGACEPQLWSIGSQFVFENLSKEVGLS